MNIAQRLERFARGRIEMAEQHTGGNRDQHLDIEMPYQRRAGLAAGADGCGAAAIITGMPFVLSAGRVLGPARRKP
jgi:hypothetical protein